MEQGGRYRAWRGLLALALIALGAATVVRRVAAESLADEQPNPRQLVHMPAPAQALLRAQMVDQLDALNTIIAELGRGRPGAAAQTAEDRLGDGSRGRTDRRNIRIRPSRYMPSPMRLLRWKQQQAAITFAHAARSGDVLRTYRALHGITAVCIDCHSSYRLQ